MDEPQPSAVFMNQRERWTADAARRCSKSRRDASNQSGLPCSQCSAQSQGVAGPQQFSKDAADPIGLPRRG